MDKPPLYDQLNCKGFIDWQDINIFENVVNIAKPKSILEIGFFRGASSFFWLYLSNAKVTSIDPMGWQGCLLENAEKLKQHFPNRFSFIQKSSQDSNLINELQVSSFDLIFIDGDHFYEQAHSDIQLAFNLKIPYIFIDDNNNAVKSAFNNVTRNRNFSEIFTVNRRGIPMTLIKNLDSET